VSNLTKARWEIVGEGALDKYVIASASIPYIFEAVTIDGMIYADGGLLNNLPAQALQGKCNTIIGVDVLPHYEAHNPLHAMDILMMPVRALVHSNSSAGRAICDFLIEPAELKPYNSFSFEKYSDIYKIGYTAAIAYIEKYPEMKNLM
jgi:NTE family protein